jgi:hypothetical protein
MTTSKSEPTPDADPVQDERAAHIRDELLQRAEGMSPAAREELFVQQRRVGGQREVGPALYVDAAESTPVFRGLNHTRDLLTRVKAAVELIVTKPEEAKRLHARTLGQERPAAPAGSPDND